MGLFSFFGLGSGGGRSSSSGDGCKTYKTQNGPTITQCKTGTKTFTHQGKTKKGTKQTKYTYGQ